MKAANRFVFGLALALVLALPLVSLGEAGGPSSSLGSVTIKGEPWLLIETGEQLAAIGQAEDSPLDGNYLLQQDIALDPDGDWAPIGTAENPFTGTLNGNGFEISGLPLATPQSDPIGLVGYAQGAKVYNMILREGQEAGGFSQEDGLDRFVLFPDDSCQIFDCERIGPAE